MADLRPGKEALEETVVALRGRGVEALGIAADVSGADDVEQVVAATVEHYGRIDVLVNNAGDAWYGRTLDTTDEQWSVCMDINLYSAVRFTRAVVPHMRRQGGGRIINISTVGAHSPIGGLVDYEAAKAALLCFSKTMAGELARRQHPGELGVPCADSHAAVGPSGRLDDPPRRRDPRGGLPQPLPPSCSRWGASPHRTRSRAWSCFLASERAGFVTGVAYNIDGGYTKSIA